MKYFIRNAEPPALKNAFIMRFDDDGLVSSIPMKEENTDYQAYLAWVEDGNVATEWTPDLADNGS